MSQKKADLKKQPVLKAESSLLELFPLWTEPSAPEKEGPAGEKYEDVAGLSLPPATQPFLDAWKRAEELVQNAPNVPMVFLKSVQEVDKKGKATTAFCRELEGKLYSGHETFDWMFAVLTFIISAEKSFKKGEYLWELISPKDKDGMPVRVASGRYKVKLWILDAWRTVTVDDRMPVDLFGRSLFVGIRPLQLWPLLLCKALLKVMAAYKSLHLGLPHQVAAFQMLTGWSQENLVDPLAGPRVADGSLFDRLEDQLVGPLLTPQQQQLTVQETRALASCCLLKRSRPERKPPRIIVLAGPSAVGRSALIERLVQQYPDKFGKTVSTTSRRPKEHEVHGRDYYFTDKHTLLADVRENNFLEVARVGSKGSVSYWYGTSLSTVREVAATGKLCVTSLDLQGVQALRANERVDGLYVYIETSSPAVLAARQKARLKEVEPTVQKRLLWAQQQVSKASQPGVFDHVLQDTDLQAAYHALKEAISTLSPIIRNRLRGLPAYVLDYSDLIPPNSVEQPFLKPVLLAGVDHEQKRKLLKMLQEEFPDVFAFPRITTTWPKDEHKGYMASDGDELTLPASMSARWPTTPRGSLSANDIRGLPGPTPVTLATADFDAMAASGQFLEAHEDLFVHPMVAHKHGWTLQDVKAVIATGKLPLLATEVEGAEAAKQSKQGCLTVFLSPPSVETHEQRLRGYLTESDEEIAERQAVAAREKAAAAASGAFDAVVVNDTLDLGYEQLCAAISKLRPDIITTANTGGPGGQSEDQTLKKPHLLLCGPPDGGRPDLVSHLLQRFPRHFALPERVTDRKPGKGEKDTAELEFVKPEVFAKMGKDGQLVMSLAEAGGSQIAVKAASIEAVAATGKMAILEVDSLQQLQQQLQLEQQQAGTTLQRSYRAFVCRPGGLAAAGPASPADRAATLLQEAVSAKELFQVLITADDKTVALAQLQGTLSSTWPSAIPPLLNPLVVVGPFGSGKRAVLRELLQRLPDVIGFPHVVTTKPRTEGAPADLEVVSLQAMEELQAKQQLLAVRQVLGHTYGISVAAVQQLQAAGKVAIIDLDKVADAVQLKASGFKARYLCLKPDDMDQLRSKITKDILANPPLGHEPVAAAESACQEVVAEVAAGEAAATSFDDVLQLDCESAGVTLGKVLELLRQCYPSVIPESIVWGFGRALWDPKAREYGRQPLRLVLLGPAASGKTTQAMQLARRYQLPLVNAGDLLHAEVASGSALGMEAKQYMDDSKTVPDRFFLELVGKRLGQPDCQIHGWLLDGFPHTDKQAAVLESMGHVADKAIFFEATHSLLLERVRNRRVDYQTGAVYHLPDGPSASEAIKPLAPDGKVDQAVMARLSVRHDDSQENVTRRLRFWDKQVPGLRAAFASISLRVQAAGPLPQIEAACTAFIELEQEASTVPELLPSWKLEELTYQITKTLRYRRQQLVKLQQVDGKSFWVDILELARNSSCMVVAHNPTCFPQTHSLKWLETGSVVPKRQVLQLDLAEPSQLLVGLSMGPQHVLQPPQAPAKKVFCITGPTGSGRQSLAQLLLRDFPSKLAAIPLLTTRKPHLKELQAQQQQEQATTPCTGADSHCAISSSTGSSRSNSSSESAVSGDMPGGYGVVASASGPAAAMGPPGGIKWEAGSKQLLRYMSEGDLHKLEVMGLLVGRHQNVGCSYATSRHLLEQVWEEGLVAMLVGPWQLGQQLEEDLGPGVQVVRIYLSATAEALDIRMRQQGILEEWGIQQHLADACEQGRLFVSNQDQQQQEQRKSLVEVVSSDQALQLCYSRVKDVLSQYWPQGQTHMPGLLLLQSKRQQTGQQQQKDEHAAAGGPASRTTVTDEWLAGAEMGGDLFSSAKWGNGFGGSTMALVSTVLRVQSITAAGAMLQLPRGKHILQVLTPDWGLHAVSLAAAVPFTVGDAVKVLAAAEGTSVLCQEGEHEALQLGTVQVLFRYLLKPAEVCTFSAHLSCSNPLAQAAARLLLLDAASTAAHHGVLSRVEEVQLQPCEKGYLLVGLVQPVVGTPAGAWSCHVLSSCQLAPLQELPVIKINLLTGEYTDNQQGFLCRYLISPTAPTCISLCSCLSKPEVGFDLQVHDVSAAKEVTWNGQYSMLAEAKVPDGVVDPSLVAAPARAVVSAPALVSSPVRTGTAGVKSKETTPGKGEGVKGSPASAGAAAQQLQQKPPNPVTQALLPGLMLNAGKYMVTMQLTSSSSGANRPTPGRTQGRLGDQSKEAEADGMGLPMSWQLQVLSSSDEKVCPVAKDDSWDRYFKATIDSWQQEAAGGSATAASAKGGAAAGKDRANRAAAALERYLAEQLQPDQQPSKNAIPCPDAAMAGNDAGKVRGRSSVEGIVIGEQQQQRPKSGAARVVVRQLKGGSSMELDPEKYLQRLAAAVNIEQEDTSGCQSSQRRSSTCPKLLSSKELAEKAKAAADQEDRGAAAAAAAAQEDRKKELATMQARKAAEFASWRSDMVAPQKAPDAQWLQQVQRLIPSSRLPKGAE